MIAYKLFRVLKDGNITPLFINKKCRLPLNEWLPAESHETKGYKYRPFWHCTNQPAAPHLSEKGRAWYKVKIGGYKIQKRPKNQGGIWYLANWIIILEKV